MAARSRPPPFASPVAQRGVLVRVRVRSNQVFFRPPPEAEGPARGHPRWYGEGNRQWPMHRCPCTLIRVWVTTPEGEMVYPRPLWLALFGPGQEEGRYTLNRG